MLKEWMITLRRYFQRANSVLAKDINGKSFPKGNLIVYKLAFWGIACVIVAFLPQGLSDGFIDYIKDIFAIFVGFFVTVLCFVFDKLDTERILTPAEEDNVPAEQRRDSRKNVKIKQEHNYTVRFFYTIGLIILLSTLVILLLIPNIFWKGWFNLDVRDYEFVESISGLSWSNIKLFSHLMLCVLYRIVIIVLTIKVFYFTTYSVSSLLQVLINKKKFEIWN